MVVDVKFRVCAADFAGLREVHLRLRQERPAEPAHWDELCRLRLGDAHCEHFGLGL